MSPSLVTLLSCTVTKLMGSKIHFLFLSPSNDLSRNSWMSDFTFREKKVWEMVILRKRRSSSYFVFGKTMAVTIWWRRRVLTQNLVDSRNWIERDQCMKISRDIILNHTYYTKSYCWEVVENAWNFHVFLKFVPIYFLFLLLPKGFFSFKYIKYFNQV